MSRYLRLPSLFVAGLFLLFAAPAPRPFTVPTALLDGMAITSAPSAETVARLEQSFGKLPLYFVENQGQMDDEVAYYIQGSDKTIYFTSTGVTYALTAPVTDTLTPTLRHEYSRWPSQRERELPSPVAADFRDGVRATQRWAVKLDFVGANPDVRPVGLDQTEAVISYFKGPKEDWHAGLPTYSRVLYRELWPGIDLLYTGTVDRMKYEFIVRPGANPSQIRLAYRGADVALNEAGQLVVSTPIGGFSDDTPVAYQEIDGQRVPVSVAYALVDDPQLETHNSQPETRISPYGFHVGAYDPTRPLVLDPAVIVYCGYVGGSDNDYGLGIAVNGAGNAYVTGQTYSTEATFPVVGGPDLTYNGNYDAFVAKVSADGTSLDYCGYIGGSGTDWGLSIAVSGAGNAYVTGETYSTEATFPVIGGPDLTYNGNYDAFVAKVSADGTSLDYCGYIGGSDWDAGGDIAVDGIGNAYITGWASAGSEGSFPVTVGPDLTFNGSEDAFVAKVRADGFGLVYCGYIGGSSRDSAYGIAVDGMGSAYITGSTDSTQATFPVTAGPDLTHNGGGEYYSDAFVAKVNAAGTGLAYCGYIGGSGSEYAEDIAVDGAGNAYVTGFTDSTEATFPVVGGPDLTYNGGVYGDAFVAKVSSDGTSLGYCGYIGGSDNDSGESIAVGGAGNAYITGDTASTEATFPVVGGPGLTHNGDYDAFVAKVSANGTSLLYCGYIGGLEAERGYGIAVDGTASAYVTGYARSTEATFPVVGGPGLTHNGGPDAFVAKVSEGAFFISGSVRDSGGAPIAGVTVSAGLDGGAVTNASGDYTLTSLITGTCTFTPALSGYAFAPPSRTVGVPPSATGQDFIGTASIPWTLMFYLDGDNNLDDGYTLPAFNQLEAAADNPNVRIVALLDRSHTNDSAYYQVQYDTSPDRLATYTANVNYWPQGELNMGATDTLTSFVNWSRAHYPAQYYALVLSNHGSGLGGAMRDDTSSGDHLTVTEIGTALASITLTGTNRIDVLYMDACLMAMIEDAYQVRGYVDYYVASENIKFGLPAPHSQAISSITATTTPAQLAALFTTTYDDACNGSSLPCTMSTADVSRLSNVVTATNSLAQLLSSQMATVAITLTNVRTDVQRFQMDRDYAINPSDDYIDLHDFARLVEERFHDGAIQTAAQGVMDAVSAYVVAETHQSGRYKGNQWDLDNSHGVSIFFPSWASSFYSAYNYDFAVGATWPGATSLSDSQAVIAWGPMLVSYFQVTQPGGPDDPMPPELMPLLPGFEVYVPIALRNH